MSKLSDELRQRVLHTSWLLDGEGTAPRKPSSWEDVAKAVAQELSTRCDVRSIANLAGNGGKERMRNVADGINHMDNDGGKRPRPCKICQKTGHISAACPSAACERREGNAFYNAKYASDNNKVCSVCLIMQSTITL